MGLKFYEMHWSAYDNCDVDRNDYMITEPRVWELLVLYHCLREWMGHDFAFDLTKGTFVRIEVPVLKEQQLEVRSIEVEETRVKEVHRRKSLLDRIGFLEWRIFRTR